MKAIAPLCLALLLCACGKPDEPADPVAELKAGNTMSCLVGSLQLSGKGEQVGFGSFGIGQGKLSLSFTLNDDYQGQVHIVSSSLMAIPLKTGTYSFPDAASRGMSLAFYEIRNQERDLLKSYGGSNYYFYFSPVENDPDAKLSLVVDKLHVSSSPHAGLQRVHVAGSFKFNGAALPGDKQSDACSMDGIQRSIKSLGGKRLLPMYDAQVCGAEKKHVRCTYEVTADVPAV